MEEEDVVMDSPKLNGSLVGPKGKFDLEMGGKLGKDGGMKIPGILQNLDYNGLDDNLKRKVGEGDAAFDPFFLAANQEPRNSQQTFNVGGNAVEDKRSQ